MAVKLVIAVRDGWKQVDNQRFGQCMEIRFVNTVDGKVMFRYAPLLSDERFWSDSFTKLKEYDKLHKDIYGLVMSMEGESLLSDGVCSKSEPVVSESFGRVGDC